MFVENVETNQTSGLVTNTTIRENVTVFCRICRRLLCSLGTALAWYLVGHYRSGRKNMDRLGIYMKSRRQKAVYRNHPAPPCGTAEYTYIFDPDPRR